MSDISLVHFKWFGVSAIRKAISDLLKKHLGTVVISKNGQPVAVLMSMPEYRALEEMASQSVNTAQPKEFECMAITPDLSFEFVNISNLVIKLREFLENEGVFKISVMKNGKPIAVVLCLAEYEVLLTLVDREQALFRSFLDDDEYNRVRRGETGGYTIVAE